MQCQQPFKEVPCSLDVAGTSGAGGRAVPSRPLADKGRSRSDRRKKHRIRLALVIPVVKATIFLANFMSFD
jgi:hypothetical protein